MWSMLTPEQKKSLAERGLTQTKAKAIFKEVVSQWDQMTHTFSVMPNDHGTHVLVRSVRSAGGASQSYYEPPRTGYFACSLVDSDMSGKLVAIMHPHGHVVAVPDDRKLLELNHFTYGPKVNPQSLFGMAIQKGPRNTGFSVQKATMTKRSDRTAWTAIDPQSDEGRMVLGRLSDDKKYKWADPCSIPVHVVPILKDEMKNVIEQPTENNLHGITDMLEDWHQAGLITTKAHQQILEKFQPFHDLMTQVYDALKESKTSSSSKRKGSVSASSSKRSKQG